MKKFGKYQHGRMHWVIIVGAVVVVILAVLTSTVLIQDESDESLMEAVDDARTAALASEHAPTFGDPDAPVHIVEFLDPACETCALFYPMVKGWMSQVPGKIRLTVRHVPFHRGAEHAVQVLEASRAQGLYWETLEAMLASQAQWTRNHVVLPDQVIPAVAHVGLDLERLESDINDSGIRERMEQDQEDAVTLKVRATPQYFVNGRELVNFGAENLAALVRDELEKAERAR
jgi:protein-disulfide isomerase